jgi:glycosyltransferase involved in cell wall biosynthesis
MKVLFLPDYAHANAYQRELAAALERTGVTIVGEPTARRRILPILRAAQRNGRPGIVHVHWTEPYVVGSHRRVSRLRVARTLTELRLLKRAGSRIVWTAHDLARHDHPVDPLELRFERSLFTLCSAVIVHCDAARSILAETLGLPAADADRIQVIPHGNYLDAYPNAVSREEARRRLGLPSDARVVAFVGWVREYKGVRELLQAFGALDRPDARLVVAGRTSDPGFAAEIEQLAALDRRVMLKLAFIPDEELQVYLNASNLVAMPYKEIFTSGSAILAMSFGRAVLAPRAGCIPETLDEAGGVLYDPGDPSGLTAALERAMDADLDAMGAHNLARSRDLDWARIAAATARIYEAARG